MLILTRRPGERVVIGDDVTVMVMEVTGQTVRLGIAAPKELPIYREEIWLAIHAEQAVASDALPSDVQSGPSDVQPEPSDVQPEPSVEPGSQ